MTYERMIDSVVADTGAPRALVDRAAVEFGRYGLGEVLQVVRFVMAEIARAK